MAASSLSSSSVTIDGFTYDVFLSFRGTDTRHVFTGNLWKALKDRGIYTFIDKEDILKGKEISESLLLSIEQSRTAIVVLSPNYATSSFCLDELSHILDCITGRGRLVWPIFYDVNPSDVRWLEGTYGEAMAAHKKSSLYDMDRLQKWENALHQVANLSGTPFKTGGGYQYEFIEKIVEEVSKHIKPFSLPVADYLVGLKSQKQDVISLLNVESGDGVHMVGIHGVGGIGKTTLALAVYNSIVHQFEGSCFLENIRADSEKYGLTYFQKIILSTIAGEKKELTSVREGISILEKRLRQKKVLVLLDDVDKLEQLRAIVGEPKWFGLGSRIIITTRDKGLLTSHGVESAYEVKELNKDDALELLKWKAFKTNDVSSSYEDVLNRVVAYASGLPLALEVIASRLVKKGIEEWESALERYERISNDQIQDILKVSFDTLNKEEKSVFLDIACCFKGHERAKVEKILHAHYGGNMKNHITVLVEKSLIKISESNNVTLHDLIEDMGKQIVKQESPEEPGKRSRLWYPEDIVQVLEENTGTSKIKIIYLDSRNRVKWDGKAFKKTKNLRTLIIRGAHFSRSPKYLPNSLRILNWMRYPSSSLPLDFYPKKLAICKLDYGEFTSITCGDLFKKLENMRVLNLDDCEVLTQIPDVSGLANLEEFSFRYCKNLITIDDSVGLLGKLKILHADNCRKLRSFPSLELISLEELHLSCCDSLESFPPIVRSLDKLKILHADYCQNLRSFPPLKLASLEELDLSNCSSLESFPSVDGLLDKLKILSFSGCGELRSIPPLNLPSLEQLNVNGCKKLRTIPSLNLASLKQLHLLYCYNLESFPEILGEMKNITKLCLYGTPINELPFSFQNLTGLQILYLTDCGIIQLSNNIIMMSKLTKLIIGNGGWKFPKHEEGEEKVSPTQSSRVEVLSLWNCNLSDGSLEIGIKWFANVKELYLSGSKFTILPESIEKCNFIWKLIMDNCGELQEIKGIPPKLKTFSALDCNSLTLSSKSKLLDQRLHEAGNTWFRLPRAINIPEWFDHQGKEGLSVSFWFRNKFPAISICAVSPLTWGTNERFIRVMINGNTYFYLDEEIKFVMPKFYHLHLFHMQMEKFKDNPDKKLLENKWNHAEVDLGFAFQKSGIHVLKERSSMEDIRFTNPENDVNIL